MLSDYIPFWYNLFNNDNYFGIIYLVIFYYTYMKKDFYLLFIPFLLTLSICLYFMLSGIFINSPIDDAITVIFLGLIITRMGESKLEKENEENDKQ